MVIWHRPLPETARAPSNLTNENVSNRGNKGFSSPVYCDRSTSHASINSTYSRINRERGESAFPTIGFNGRSGYKQNAAAWWKGFDLLDGVYLVNWCNIRYWFFLSLLLANWYFWCGLQFLFCIEDPPALFPDRLGTVQTERGIPAYASISAPGSIGWHLRSGAPSMALLRPYNTLTLFLLFFSFFPLFF